MQKVTDEDLIKQCNAAIGAEPSMYNQNIIPHLHRYFITGYRVCEQDATLSPPDAGKEKRTFTLKEVLDKIGEKIYLEADKYGGYEYEGFIKGAEYVREQLTAAYSITDAGKEQEAVAFAEWAATSYTFLPDTKVWYESGVGVSYKSHFFTTSELYTLYKQQNK